MARLLVVGAGQVATGAAHAALADGVVDGVAGVVDADGIARDRLAAALDSPGYATVAELGPAREGDRALVILGPAVDSVAPVILRLLSLGYHVVSTGEELAWPPRHTWNALHTAARTHQRVIIMIGVNAGFVMDRLPLLAAAAARRVRAVTVTRRIDSSLRREAFLAFTGRGLDADAFRAAVATRDVGHRGLVPGAKLLAHALGWPNHDVIETIEPVLDGATASGMRQVVTLRAGGPFHSARAGGDLAAHRPGRHHRRRRRAAVRAGDPWRLPGRSRRRRRDHHRAAAVHRAHPVVLPVDRSPAPLRLSDGTGRMTVEARRRGPY